MEQIGLFETEAESNRNAGIHKAISHADRYSNKWSSRALYFLRLFIDWNSRNDFLMEDARQFAEKQGLEFPPSKRAWGAIAIKAKKLGFIKSCGFALTSNPKAHKTPACLWRPNG